MTAPEMRCAVLAGPHHGLAEGIRGLLATVFDAVVIVLDEISLFGTAKQLGAELAVVDLGLSRGDAFDLVRRFRVRFPAIKLIIISGYEPLVVGRVALEAGAHAYVTRSAIATNLLPAVDAVLVGKTYMMAGHREETG